MHMLRDGEQARKKGRTICQFASEAGDAFFKRKYQGSRIQDDSLCIEGNYYPLSLFDPIFHLVRSAFTGNVMSALGFFWRRQFDFLWCRNLREAVHFSLVLF